MLSISSFLLRQRTFVRRFRSVTAGVLASVAVTVGSASVVQAQQAPQWMFSGQSVNFRNLQLAAPSQTALPTIQAGGPTLPPFYANDPLVRSYGRNSLWNAQYDYQGNLLFYISGTRVYKADGTEITYAGTDPYYGSIGHPSGQRHITIVPRPGSCDEYYLLAFDVYPNDSYPRLFWWSLNTSTWTLSGAPYYGSPNEVHNALGQPVKTYFLYNSVMAVGPPVFADGSRWVYVCTNGSGRVIMVKVSPNSITSNGELLPQPINGVTYAGPVGTITSAKVSNDGTRLVYTTYDQQFGATSGKLASVALAPAGAQYPGDLDGYGALPPAQVIRSYTLPGQAFGVEFTARDASGNDKLLVSYGTDNAASSGIAYAQVSSSSIALSPVTASTASCAQSQLERGLDGRVYAVTAANSNGTYLLRRLIVPTSTATAPILGQTVGGVTPTLIPFGGNDALPYQRAWANQWQPTGTANSDPSGYIHTYASTSSVNVNSGPQTVTLTLAPGFTPYLWGLGAGGASGVTFSASGNTCTYTFPQNSVALNTSTTAYIGVRANTPCGVRQTLDKAILVTNTAPCPGCGSGRPLPTSGGEQPIAYPNPATDRVTIAGLAGAAEATLTHVLTGRQTRFAVAGAEATLSVAALPEGTYWLEVRAGEQVRRERLVVRH